MSVPLKGFIQKTIHNHNEKAAHNYSIIDNLAQAPTTISTLEVLQILPMQHKELVSTISGVYPSNSNIMTFDP